MSITRTMEMASRVRAKLMRDSCNRKASLLALVVQANLLDRLMDDILDYKQQAAIAPVREVKFEMPASSLNLPDLTPASNSTTSITEYEILSDSSDDDDEDETYGDYSEFHYDHFSQNTLFEPHTPLIDNSRRDDYSNIRQEKSHSQNTGVVVYAEENISEKPADHEILIDYPSASMVRVH